MSPVAGHRHGQLRKLDGQDRRPEDRRGDPPHAWLGRGTQSSEVQAEPEPIRERLAGRVAAGMQCDGP
jgi:hypothetical protein